MRNLSVFLVSLFCILGLFAAGDVTFRQGSGGGTVTIQQGSGGGGSGTPSGSNTNVQFNNSGAFGGNSGFQYDSSVSSVTLNGKFSETTNSTTILLDDNGGGGDPYITLNDTQGSPGGGFNFQYNGTNQSSWSSATTSFDLNVTTNSSNSAAPISRISFPKNSQKVDFSGPSSVIKVQFDMVANSSFTIPVVVGTMTITNLPSLGCLGTDSVGKVIAGTCGGGGASALEVFSNFDAVRSSPTASIATGDALKLSVSGSTAVITVDFSSVTAQGNTFNGNNQLVKTGSTGGIGVSTISTTGTIIANGNISARGSNGLYIGLSDQALLQYDTVNYNLNIATHSSVSGAFMVGSNNMILQFSIPAQMQIIPSSQNVIGVYQKALSNQTAPFMQWANSGGTAISSITVTGGFTGLVSSFPATGVTSGSYTNTNLTVDAQGRISAASNGSAGSGGGYAVEPATVAFKLNQGLYFGGIETVIANKTLTSTHTIVLGSATISAATTIILPPASNTGQQITIKKVDTSTFPVIIQRAASDFIESTTTIYLNALYQYQTLVADGGTHWLAMNGISKTPTFAGPGQKMGTAASAVGVSSTAYLTAFDLNDYCAMTGIRIGNNGASGNVDFGIYDKNLVLLSSSAAQLTVVNRNTYNFITPLELIPGQYFIAMSPSDAVASWSRQGSSLGIGNYSKTVSFPLPATITGQIDSSLGFLMQGICAGGQTQ